MFPFSPCSHDIGRRFVADGSSGLVSEDRQIIGVQLIDAREIPGGIDNILMLVALARL
jgi:hypothetical protein